jgi:plasmid stabilization system protein ParE
VRNVIEEERVRRAVDDALTRWPRAEDAWEAVTWVVARDPRAGTAETESGNTRSFTFEGARSIGMPSVTIIYEITEWAIIIHDALFTDSKHGQAGKA